MSVQTESNRYPGVNAHLNSFLQQRDGGWDAFHARHVNDLAAEIDTRLPAHYYAVAEKSLQISAYPVDDELDVQRRSKTTPDVTVYRTGAGNEQRPAAVNVPTMRFPLAEVFSEEEFLTGIVIYQLDEGKLPGTPVTRVELLSPGNKPGGTHHLQYLSKRQETLKSGLNLVEIDYLHELRPVIRRVPSYPDHQTGAYPYTIIVSNTHPTLEVGMTEVYGFGVTDPLPTINIPLADNDAVMLDFGIVYQRSFQSLRVFSMMVDYGQEPVNFSRYHDADRESIRQLMASPS